VIDKKTGEDLLKLAEEKIGAEYVYGADVPLKQGDHYDGPYDCAEFATERVQELTGQIYGALRPESANPDPFTGGWYDDMRHHKVIQIPVEQAIKTPGALLLRYPNRKHMVFSDGLGGTVEAMGSDYGVCRGRAKGRGWNYGILIPGINYQEV
jgi:N-acetylmuramoyl-L-alanine amidase